MTTVVFGLDGGFVTVPVMISANGSLGSDAPTVAVATSSAVMVVNAAVATAATRRAVLVRLRRSGTLLGFLAMGGVVTSRADRALCHPHRVRSAHRDLCLLLSRPPRPPILGTAGSRSAVCRRPGRTRPSARPASSPQSMPSIGTTRSVANTPVNTPDSAPLNQLARKLPLGRRAARTRRMNIRFVGVHQS